MTNSLKSRKNSQQRNTTITRETNRNYRTEKYNNKIYNNTTENLLEGLNSRAEMMEVRISKLEDTANELVQPERQKVDF
jgi:hypothetical protein